MIKLRPHHILCIHQFKGYGYNNKFIENMFYIISQLNYKKVIISTENDNICEKCPNLLDNLCHYNDKVKQLDEKVIKNLHIKLDLPIYFKDLKYNIEKYLTKEMFNNICTYCNWYKDGYCKYSNFFKTTD